MAEITVEEKDKNNFLVTVAEDDKTEHSVSFSDDYWSRLCSRTVTKKKCIEKAFKFLLAREPKESILRSFDMTVIHRYFPEFEQEIFK